MVWSSGAWASGSWAPGAWGVLPPPVPPSIVQYQSDYAIGKKQTATPQEVGRVACQRVTSILSGEIDANTIIEIAVLPAYYSVVGMMLIPEGDFDIATADVGIMSGAPGDDGPRTVGDEFFDGVALTGVVRNTSGLLAPPVDRDRSIGVRFNDGLSASAGRRLSLIMVYSQ